MTALYARFTPLRLTGTVNVSGKAVRGKHLTASVSGSNNTGAFAYQWLRDGAAISGETASSYTLGTDDVGCSISCQVTSTEQPGSITSEALTVADKRTPSSDPEEETVTAGGKTDEKVSANEDPCEAFTDVNRDLWYHGAIDYALVSGIMEGFSKTCFGPDNTLTRAQLVTMLWRHAGEPVVNYAMDFSDIPAEGWYTEAVRWAASMGITEGYGNGTFGANDSITREQLAVFIYRYEQKVNGGGFKGAWMFDLQFSDKDQLSDWAGEAMCWCVMNGVLEGKGSGILDPKGTATRAQAAQMLMNYLGK